jgi:hypothetical protein
MRRHLRRAATLAAWAGLLLAPGARAHADVPIVDTTLHLAPGEAFEVPLTLHFHRLVARYRVHDRETHGVTLTVVRSVAMPPAEGDVLVAVPLRGSGRLSRLIDCCIGVDYADVVLVVRHEGAAPLTVDLRAWAVHDEFAVVAARAEAGALEVPLALFGGLGAVALWTARRTRRRPAAAWRALPATFRGSVASFVAAIAIALLLGVAGAVRYGSGPIDGMIAVMADLPIPGGPFGSRAALLLGVLLLMWVTSIGLWIASVALGAPRGSPWPARFGVVLAGASLAGGLAMSAAYAFSLVPVLLGSVLAVPLAVSARLVAAPRRTAAGTV